MLHADLDAFYASVEQRDAPELRGRPVIVGGGVVLAASYEAKARGVRTAMGGRQARDLCPDAVVVPPRMDAYSAASRDVFAIFRDTTPLVEGISIDEAFLEVGGLRRIAGTPEQIAVRLRQRVRADVGLAISVGVARTKFLAKVASAVSKPDGLLVVEPEREEAFLLPLPVEELDLFLTQIVDRLAGRLRDRDRVCRTVVLRLRYGDFAKATRSRTLRCATDRTAVLLAVARGLLAAAQPEITTRGITLIGVSLSQLGQADTLPPELPLEWDEGERLDTVLDAVRDRFGAASVARAAQLGRDPGWSTPLLPEHE